jgi:hypothetical protein
MFTNLQHQILFILHANRQASQMLALIYDNVDTMVHKTLLTNYHDLMYY